MKTILVVAAVVALVSGGDIAKDCDEKVCTIAKNCRCSSVTSPLADPSQAPQLVSLTFNEAIVQKYYEKLWVPLLKDRKNPDGSVVSVTFFVPHEYTDYSLVVNLFNLGHEIGVHSITKDVHQSYWRGADLDTLTKEFDGQRQIISHFTKIPSSQLKGVRAPQLQFNGNATFSAYQKAGLIYDNSWPTAPDTRLFPYTLDYASTEECEATRECPNEPFAGFWVNPIIDITGKDGKSCHEILGCEKDGSATEIRDWLLAQVEASRSSNRAPVSLLADASWFDSVENSLQGFELFLDELGKMKDVFLVSQYQVLQWTKNPVALKDYKTGTTTKTLKCVAKSCDYIHDGQPRRMVACTACPKSYPWLGNPLGN